MISGKDRQNPIPACKLDGKALYALYEILKPKVEDSFQQHIRSTPKLDDESEEDYEKYKVTVSQLLRLSLLIKYEDGDWIRDPDTEVLKDLSKPISLIEFDSSFHYRQRRSDSAYPNSYFLVTLDFTKPEILKLNDPSFDPTPNMSNFQISSPDKTWTDGFETQINNFFEGKRNLLDVLHTNYIYTVLLLLAGFPISLLWAYRVNQQFGGFLSQINDFISTSIYIYVFIISIFVFRIGFNLIRHLFPKLSLQSIYSVKSKIKYGVLSIVFLGWALVPFGETSSKIFSLAMQLFPKL